MYAFLNKSHAQLTKASDDKMASGSNATSPQASNLSSRFSSLKVFKFSKGNDNKLPPPPPPKDEYYLRNKSMASLLPDNQSLAPSSPLSPNQPYQYGGAQPSPDANRSTMSLASSAASGISSPPLESKSRPQSRGKERALAFLKFGKRSPRSPSTSRKESEEGEAVPDEGISMPWNFQVRLIHCTSSSVGQHFHSIAQHSC
jgi:p21-activated kinase 1